MAKVRVYELAKELGINSKKLIDVLKNDFNVEVKNHMSTIEKEKAEQLMQRLTGKDMLEAEEQEKVEKPQKKVLQKKVVEMKKTAQKKSPPVSRKARKKSLTEETKKETDKKTLLRLEGRVTVGELAAKMDIAATELIKQLLELGVMANINQELEPDIIYLIAEEYGFDIMLETDPVEKELQDSVESEDKPESLKPRPPVVTVLGHVDHGKTSLLDAIRNANVTASEAGGITQHIGAYQVNIDDHKIVFLDTPGHEAFTAMRARGAQVTDIAVLVVAADDGVMPQTIEAINHAQAAGVPIIVALNKIDRPNANPERVKQQLSENNLIPEEWGGDTIIVPVSALRQEGIEDLLEAISLTAEINEYKANPNRPASGVVIEAKLDKGRGPVATVLVQNGTLRVGEPLVGGSVFGKVRAMVNDRGKRISSAGPSTPVEILGLSDVAQAGDTFQVVADERIARQVAERRSQKLREATIKKAPKISLDDLFKRIQEGEVKELKLIIKGDAQGSVEALKDSLLKLSNEEVGLQIIHSGVGSITESDVMLASASDAIIIGFNVRPEANVRRMVEAENVDMRLYRVIYEVIEDIEKAMRGLLAPEYKEVILGQAEVRQIFKVSKLGTIAGCYVTNGQINRHASVRVIRDGKVVQESKIDSLRRFKDDVREVSSGFECGILLENFNDLKEGDILEAFTEEKVEPV
ncbi:MAG: translation initiation factor IF-2 [Dethiobacteria bacterium]|jgi:translation initiation factor IF-2|nr:translation initiation factor IF-2 [Bacillota bacterium]